MIGRKSLNKTQADDASPQSFDDYALRLGDLMRGERATLGKSLLDVQRELRIKASYIAAIENCDPSAFDTPGFIAGYVRSYARYLGLDPDEAFAAFCTESGFSVAHGMSEHASTIRKVQDDAPRAKVRDPFSDPSTPFAPRNDSFFSRIEPGAVGSSLVLIGLIAGIGYGGWSVLQEVQRVQITAVDQTPAVLSELDPLDAAIRPRGDDADDGGNAVAGVFTPPTGSSFDRLYRPQALDLPVLVARDAPISTLDPSTVGVFAEASRPGLPSVQDSSRAAIALAEGLAANPDSAVVPAGLRDMRGVMVVATGDAWIRVRDESGKVLHEETMAKGGSYSVPANANNPQISIGQSGAVYFAVDGVPYGPAGRRGTYQEVTLTPAELMAKYKPADPAADGDLLAVMVELDIKRRPAKPSNTRPPQIARAVVPETVVPVGSTIEPQEPPAVVAESIAPLVTPERVIPQVTAAPLPGITVIATAETWVEVTAPSGKKLFASTMQAGTAYKVPQLEEPPVIFSGNAGGVFFVVEGKTYGPYGQSGQFGRNLELAVNDIRATLPPVDVTRNEPVAKIVAELQSGVLQPSR